MFEEKASGPQRERTSSRPPARSDPCSREDPQLAAVRKAQRLGPELRGILLTLLAMGLFGCMDGISKFLVAHYPPTLVLWLRHVAAVPVAFLILARRHPTRLLRPRAPGLQLTRIVLLVVEMNLVLVAFRVMPLADTQAILAATPLLVTALSVPFLGERVGWRRWLACAVGFVGVLIVVRPGLGVLQPGAIVALVAACLYAIYNVLGCGPRSR